MSFFASPANAQIYNCQGNWSNKPCSVQPTTVLEEAPVRTEREARVVASRKDSLLHELRMATIAAKRDYDVELTDVRLNISEVEKFCAENSNSLEVCGERVSEAQQMLDRKVDSAARLKEKEPEDSDDGRNGDKNEVTVVVDPGGSDDYLEPCLPIAGVFPPDCGAERPPLNPDNSPANKPQFKPGPFAPKPPKDEEQL